MKPRIKFRYRLLLPWLTGLFLALPVIAQDATNVDEGKLLRPLLLVQQSSGQGNSGNNPASGTLILPESMVKPDKKEKKCMTVCARWGEDCTYINRGSGGMTRSCRRTCQQFTEECF